jgi:hypothetical protein
MRDRIFHWARHANVNDWLLCGWILTPCEPMHHHEYSFMVEWLCDCKMPRPGQ